MEFQTMMILIVGMAVLCVGLVIMLGLLLSKRKSSEQMKSAGGERNQSGARTRNLPDEDTAAASEAAAAPPIPRKSPAELQSLKPPLQPSLPGKAYLLTADTLVKDTADRMVLLLEPYEALQEYKQKLKQIAGDAAKPLLLVIMGQFNSGKSSFINRLLGMDGCLKVEETPATAAVTMLSYGESPEVVAHLLDGSEQTYPYERLHSLSAEGDEEGSRLRDKVYYLEVRLPVKLLKQVTIVDTPGLNSDNPHHTKATEYFTDRADQVLWLFSYGQAASKMELSALGQLGGDWKPIGVVNRIDEHDPEEGGLDSFLNQVRRRLGSSVCRLAAVSALQAAEASLSGDQKLLQQSRWPRLEQVLQEELYDKAGMKKGIRLLSRLRETIVELQGYVLEEHKEFEKAYAYVHDHAKAIEALSGNRRKAAQQLDNWSGLTSETALYQLQEYHPLPPFVNNYQYLNQQLEMMIGVLDELGKERKQIDNGYEENGKAIDAHNASHKELEKEYAEYNKSGMFGGRPIFDWDGTGKKLDARAKLTGDRAAELNARMEQLNSQNSLYFARLERNEQEGYELAQLVVTYMRETLAEFDRLLDNQEEAMEEAQRKKDRLYWTTSAKPSAENLFGWELGALAAALNRRAGMGDGSIPAVLTEALELLQQLELELLNGPADAFLAEAAATVETGAGGDIGLNPVSAEHLIAAVAAAEEGAELDIGEGIYVLSDTLVLDKSLRLRGTGSHTTVIKGTLETLMRFAGDKVWNIEGIGFDLCGAIGTIAVIEAGQASFDNCEFSGARTPDDPDDTEERGAALTWRGQSAGSINGCRFHNNSCGVALTDSSSVTVQDSLFWYQELTAIAAEGQASLELKRCEITHSMAGVYMEGSTKGMLDKNRLWYNVHGIIGGGQAKMDITGNEAVRNTVDGIRGVDQAFLNVLGNLCQANQTGICLLDSVSGYMAANVCTGNIASGIGYETAGRLVVEMNVCTLNGEAGIAHDAGGPSLLTGNECSRNLQHGIYISGTGRHVIEGNGCHHNYDSGITVRGSEGLTFKSNQCDHNVFGIILWGQVQAKLEENRCNHNSTGGIFAGDQSKLTVMRNECSYNQTGIAIGYDAYGSITESTCENNYVYGIGFGERATGIAASNLCKGNGESGIAVIDQAAVELEKNTCSKNKLAGIFFSGSATGKASNNSCSSNELGIHLMLKAAPVLMNNECFQNLQDGIGYYDEAAGTAFENQCYRNGMDGIFVSGQSAPQLEKNVSEDNNNSGISVNAEAKPTISFNVLRNNEGFGIQVDGQAAPVLRKNTLAGNKVGEMSR